LATNASYTINPIGPMFSSTKFNFELIKYADRVLRELGVEPKPFSGTTVSMPRGSTDFANVSQVVPSLEISSKIAPEGTPWHSEVSAKAAASDEAKRALELVSEALSRVATKILSDDKFAEDVKKEFAEKH